MKRFLPVLILFVTTYAWAQQNPNENKNIVVKENDNRQELKGERTEFAQYYERARKLMIDSSTVSYQGPGGLQKANVWPTQTNPFWRDIGSFYTFSGKANVIGCKIGYQSWTQKGSRADLYDINLYQEVELGTGVPEEVLATQSFYGYEIESTGPDIDSFHSVLFASSQFTQVERGFLVTVSMENISPIADDLDLVRIFSSSRGDGRGESMAMAKLTPSSDLYNGKEFVKIDGAFLDASGVQPLMWNWDVMIIPIMDIDEVGIGYIDLKGGRFNGHFPNPAREQFTIDLDLDENKDNIRITVQSMSGRTLKTMNTGSLGIGKHFLSVDVAGLPAGSYVYTVNEGTSAFTARVIIVD